MEAEHCHGCHILLVIFLSLNTFLIKRVHRVYFAHSLRVKSALKKKEFLSGKMNNNEVRI